MDCVLQDWVCQLTWKEQVSLLGTLRSCDVRCEAMRPTTQWVRSLILRDADPSTNYMRHVEIQRNPAEVPGGWDATDQLGVACAVTYEPGRDRYRVWVAQELGDLRERLLRATRITGFNVWRFDLPVIWGWPRAAEPVAADSVEGQVRSLLRPKVDDLLLRIWHALGLDIDVFTDSHRGWGLDAVCRGTLSRGKTGHGEEAPRLFQRGEWGRLITYCLNDVTLTRDLGKFVDRYGYVVNGNTGRLVNLDPWKGGLP